MYGESSDFSALAGSLKAGRLIIAWAVRGIRLTTCQSKDDLY